MFTAEAKLAGCSEPGTPCSEGSSNLRACLFQSGRGVAQLHTHTQVVPLQEEEWPPMSIVGSGGIWTGSLLARRPSQANSLL